LDPPTGREKAHLASTAVKWLAPGLGHRAATLATENALADFLEALECAEASAGSSRAGHLAADRE